ncbi:D-aminoacyl-tRNA deacylase [Methanolacinia petrolearia]|uniref:D-aminoacyl-tRNA deacylase n=1 Tax=Methanolacinia petrolearia TaxID=54120 RepID=UPI003BACE1CC
MLIAIVSSSLDPAGTAIRKSLLSMLGTDGSEDIVYGGHTLRFFETEDRLIYENNLDERTGADLVIFISRHTSKNPFPALTVHVTGNYGDAALGGEPQSLAAAAPEWMHAVLNELNKKTPTDYRVSYEVTHHGPTDLKTPSFFVEIGSSEKEWADENAAKAVASSLLEVLSAGSVSGIRIIGFGGNHYAARETETALNSNAAFGHIVHTRNIPLIDRAMVAQMIERTSADAAYIDKKALKGEDVRKIEELISETGLPLLSEGELRSISGLEWNTYLEIRKIAGAGVPGCHVEVRNLKGAGVPETFQVDRELILEAIKADKRDFFNNVDKIPVVYLYSADGNFQPIFISYKENRLQLINALITLCVKILRKGRGTTVEGDLLTLKKTRLDPRKAAELGIKKGPLLGELASGREVEVDGRKISPSMVLTVEEKTLRIPGLEGYL